MIAFVRGTAVDMTENSVIVEAGGIGYEIYMTGTDLSQIHMGEEVKIHTYFNVREDAMQLYGFRSKDDLQMFKLLLGVNGVGPKAAVGVLAGITADELRFAILSDDVKTISRAPGVGKKTAQKMILELKDKMARESAATGLDFSGGAAVSVPAFTNKATEAAQALAVLGYTSAEVAQALKGVDVETLSLEEIIRQCLKKMVK